MGVAPGIRVRHVGNKNADMMIWSSIGADMIPKRLTYGGLLAPKFASRSNPL